MEEDVEFDSKMGIREMEKQMKKLKKIKLVPLRRLHDKTWSVFSRYIRLRDRGKCFTCTKVDDIKNMQAGHFVHKDCLDFDELNVHCQCPQCNKWKHGNLAVYAVALQQKYGDGAPQLLLIRSHQAKKWTRAELEEIKSKYEQKTKELE